MRITRASVTSKCSCSDELKYTGDIAHIAHSCIMYICPCSSIQNVKCHNIFCDDAIFTSYIVLCYTTAAQCVTSAS